MKITAILTVALAVLIGVVPFFTECFADGGKMVQLANGNMTFMKCHWTAMASLAAAIPLAVLGLLQLRSRTRESQQNLTLSSLVLGAVVIALPTALIGVCAHPDALCNLVMRPALILMGLLVVAGNLGGFVVAWRRTEQVA
jgi:hypothetical protein